MSAESDPWWDALVGVVGSVGVVEPRAPHGLIVTSPRGDGTNAVVEIVMTPGEWVTMSSVAWGDVDLAARHVADQTATQPGGQRYLCYRTYELVPSDTEVLPVDPDELRLQQLAEQYPDGVIPGGGWYAHPPEGHGQVD